MSAEPAVIESPMRAKPTVVDSPMSAARRERDSR